jgi:hypothetical protein
MAITRRPDHNRVVPGDGVGVAIWVPVEQVDVAVGLLAPHIPEAALRAERSDIVLYATVGRDTLNGRPVGHRWVNILGEPPDAGEDHPFPDSGAAVPSFAVGGMGFIGAPRASITRMWIRAGLPHVPGRIRRLRLDRAAHRVTVAIETAGGDIAATGSFAAAGDRWESHPTRYHIVTAQPPVVYHGDEWGTRHDGSGTATWTDSRGRRGSFETYVGVDVDLGWDYTFEPIAVPDSPSRG